jgi:D-alanyl-D-alanine carboxypeptidase (penicillin-binding protein 5/6)
MNQQAVRLGMKNTHFTNSTGLPHPEHYTTARDLAILARNLIESFPEYYEWYEVKEYTYNDIRQYNRNRLLWLDERVDGIKTGHTESAGYCLVTSAVEDNMRLVSVVVGAKNENGRVSASRKLLGYGFRFYETYKLYGANEQLTTMRVWKGEQDDVALGIEQSLYVTVPRGKRDDIQASMSVDAKIVAPVTAGQHYGSVDIKLGDEVLAQQPLVALTDVAEGGLWQRLVDSVLLLIE